MIKTIRTNDNNIVDYLGDNNSAIEELTKKSTCAPGSSCYLVDTGELYIKKIDKTWTQKVQDSTGGDANISEYFNTSFTPNDINANKIVLKIPEITIDGEGNSLSRAFFNGIQYTGSLKLNIKTKGIEDCSSMFDNSNLASLDLSSFDTSNVTNMSYMFGNCYNLTSLDLSNFNTSNVTDMSGMFSGCSQASSIDLSSFDTSKVTNMNSMFYGCLKLKNLNISNFDFTSVTNYESMFGEAVDGINSTVPSDCDILVKDSTAKEWLTSKFDWLTNIHYVGE